MENLGNVGYGARSRLRSKRLDINKKARSFLRMGSFTSKSFGSLAIAYWQPMALRPTLAGSLPFSALKKTRFSCAPISIGKNLFHLVIIIFNYIIIQKIFLSRGGFLSLKNWKIFDKGEEKIR